MPTLADGSRIVLGRGRVYFDRFTTAGVKTGLRMLGNVSRFEATPTTETIEMKDYTQAAAPRLKSVIVTTKVDIAMTLHEFVRENVALVLLGTETGYTQAATAVVDEIVSTSVNLGRIYRTAKRKIGTVSAKKSPSTTLVLNTDYAIEDAEQGLIRLLPGATNIANGDTLLVSYTPTAIVSPGLDRVAIAGQPNIEGELQYVADNASGDQWDYIFWKVAISPDGALGLIADDFAELVLKGEVLTDSVNHPTDPYGIGTRRV